MTVEEAKYARSEIQKMMDKTGNVTDKAIFQFAIEALDLQIPKYDSYTGRCEGCKDVLIAPCAHYCRECGQRQPDWRGWMNRKGGSEYRGYGFTRGRE